MQGRVQQADGDGQAIHGPDKLVERGVGDMVTSVQRRRAGRPWP